MRTVLKTPLLLSSLSISVLLSACGGSSTHDFNQIYEEAETIAPHGPIYDPLSGDIPTTNDLLFSGSTDGTLNIPNSSNNPVIDAVNTLDGFSTSSPITADFGMSIDPASLVLGKSLHVYEVIKNAQGAIISVTRELTDTEITTVVIGDEKSTLALVPRAPLKENTSYLVVLKKSITDTKGMPAQAPSIYSIARSAAPLAGTDFEALEPLHQVIDNMEAVAASQGVDKNDIVLTWSFTTQSITAVLVDIASKATASNIVLADTGMTSNDISSALPGIANVSIGTIDLPYYLEAPSADNPTAPLTSYWKGAGESYLTRNNTMPVSTMTLTTPVMMTTPNENSGHTMPAAGWPIVIYQHGITRARTDMLGYADAMAQAGFAVIAIDLPLHGITDTTNPFHANNTAFLTDVEANFDVDFVNNETGATEPDGIIDNSGDHFINLTSLLTSRDNPRQGVANLLTLRRSLINIPNINAENVGFVAHSLGGIVGITYLGVETKSLPSSLITTGVSIGTILKDSAVHGPRIKSGLAALGVTGSDYDAFMAGTQWVLDPADPINYATTAASIHPLHLMEIVGDGATHQTDMTIPNTSTELLAALTGSTAATEATNPTSIGLPKIVRFTQGNHATILDPMRGAPEGTNYLNVYTEMHSQLVKFQASAGSAVIIEDLDIILN